MTEKPAPFRELDREPERARAFTDRAADPYEELLRRPRSPGLPRTERRGGPLGGRDRRPGGSDGGRGALRLPPRLMTEVQQDGRVFFSNVPGGRFVPQVCIVNFRT